MIKVSKYIESVVTKDINIYCSQLSNMLKINGKYKIYTLRSEKALSHFKLGYVNHEDQV